MTITTVLIMDALRRIRSGGQHRQYRPHPDGPGRHRLDTGTLAEHTVRSIRTRIIREARPVVASTLRYRLRTGYMGRATVPPM